MNDGDTTIATPVATALGSLGTCHPSERIGRKVCMMQEAEADAALKLASPSFIKRNASFHSPVQKMPGLPAVDEAPTPEAGCFGITSMISVSSRMMNFCEKCMISKFTVLGFRLTMWQRVKRLASICSLRPLTITDCGRRRMTRETETLGGRNSKPKTPEFVRNLLFCYWCCF